VPSGLFCVQGQDYSRRENPRKGCRFDAITIF
jgi:hypothetical protein